MNGSVDAASGTRFPFGENWLHFLHLVDETRVAAACDSLTALLPLGGWRDRSFIDVGCGSGLFSLAARRLGASVHSFDFDAKAVACTRELRRRYAPDDPAWVIEQGSILDESYVGALGEFDAVYSWGVLHHTGDLWRSLEMAGRLVAPGGYMAVAIYNDQGWLSRYWGAVKRLYNRAPVYRMGLLAVHAPYFIGARLLFRALTGRPVGRRGMSPWYDLKDWLGGYPFEVASPARVTAYCAGRGFRLIASKDCGRRHGCNEFVFQQR